MLPIIVSLPMLLTAAFDDADDLETLLKNGAATLEKGKTADALAAANKAITAAPKDARGYFLRGNVHVALRKHKDAIADFDKCLALDSTFANAYQSRGGEYFKLAEIDKSLADFDRFIELRPAARPSHWQRGIALYYARKYKEGAEQFVAGEKDFHDDVENAVWHYLCKEKVVGADKARAVLLKVDPDKRVPMMVVYDLFASKAKPEDVLAAVEKGKPDGQELKNRQFYANLYLGLYYDSVGDKKKAKEHLEKAGADEKIGGYMGDVARVHVKLLLDTSKPPRRE
jgi:lipoprotein NlpI